MVYKIIFLSTILCCYIIITCRASSNIDGSYNLNYSNDFEFCEGLEGLYSLLTEELDMYDFNLESNGDNALKPKNFEITEARNFESSVDGNLTNLVPFEKQFVDNGPPLPLEDFVTIDGSECVIQDPEEYLNRRRYEVIALPEDVYSGNRRRCRQEDLRNNEINAVKKDSQYLEAMEFDSDKLGSSDDISDGEISFNEAYALIKHRFTEETGLSVGIRWDLLDISALPLKYSEIVFNSYSFSLKKIYANRELLDEIHFVNAPTAIDDSGREYYFKIRKKLNYDLRLIFLLQHPGKRFNLKAYDIENWPEDVSVLKSNWSMSEIAQINHKLSKLVFHKKNTPTFAERIGLDALGSLDGVLIKSWRKDHVYARLLERFRVETGNPAARAIDWSKLDRRDIPIRYGPYKIHSTSMKNEKFFKNREIVDNIHFFKDSEKLSKKRPLENDASSQSDVLSAEEF